MIKGELKKYVFLITYAVVLFLTLMNISVVFDFCKYIIGILTPLFIGIIIAFILNILMRFFEDKLFLKFFEKKKVKKSTRRTISVILTYISFFIIVTIIVMFIIPQISKSISSLSASFPSYAEQTSNFINRIASRYDITQNLWNDIINNLGMVLTNTSQFIKTVLPGIFNFTKGITTGVINLFMGFVFSVYMLISKEKLILILKKIIYAFFPTKIAEKIIKIFSDSNIIFSSFIRGQLTEALILGVLCFLGMTIFRMPYAPLIGVIVGITSLIPVLGAYIGTIPSALLILMESPIMALWFIIFIIVLQQLEGNLIYPKVVGNAVGLNGLWVLLAIVVGGSLFGVIGILLGVPTLAVVYSLMSKVTNRRIQEKEIEII